MEGTLFHRPRRRISEKMGQTETTAQTTLKGLQAYHHAFKGKISVEKL